MQKYKLSVIILFTVTILFWFSQYAYTSYVNPELEKMGIAASFMGFVAGAYGLTQTLVRIPVGIISDKWQKKIPICMGCLCVSLASACMFFFYTPASFLIGRALGGIAASAWVPITVLYSSYYKSDDATKSITMINMAQQVGRLLSFIIASVVVVAFGEKSAFALSAIGGFIGLIISIFIIEDRDKKREPISIKALISVSGNRNLIITTVLAIFFQIIAFSTFFSFTANHAYSIGATPAQLSYVNVAMLAPAVIISYLTARYILKYIKAQWLVVIGFVLTAIYCGFLPFTETIIQLYIFQAVSLAGAWQRHLWCVK